MVKGIIIRISGPVVDVKFENGLPKIKDALTVGEGKTQKVMEVAQHLDERIVPLRHAFRKAKGFPAARKSFPRADA